MNFTPKQKAGLAAIVVCVVLVIVWLLIKKKKPKVAASGATADGRPSAVTDIVLKPVGQSKDSTGTTENYTGTVSDINKRGFYIKFKTPVNSGIPGNRNIVSYKIYLVLAGVGSGQEEWVNMASTYSYLIDPAKTTVNPPQTYLFDTFLTGTAAGSDTTYRWKDGSTGNTSGGLDAEIFINANMLATLSDAGSYKVVMLATNAANVTSIFANKGISDAITYNKCTAGETGSCNWGTTLEAQTKSTQNILTPALIQFDNATGSRPTAGFTGTTAPGTPCIPLSGARSDVLYKYDNANSCKPKGCKTDGYWLNTTTGFCELKLAAGQPCTPATGAVEGHSFKYYNSIDSSSGSIAYDDTGKLNPSLICEDADITNVTDMRAQPCVMLGNRFPSLANPDASTTQTYSFGPGMWGSCPGVCKSPWFGPTCKTDSTSYPTTFSPGLSSIDTLTGLKNSDFIYGYDGVGISCYISETIGSTTVWKKHPNIGTISVTRNYSVLSSGQFMVSDNKTQVISGWPPSYPGLGSTLKKIGLKTIPVDGVKIPYLIITAYTSNGTTATILGHYKLNLTSSTNFTTVPVWIIAPDDPYA
jgi:hypothetical protein